MYVTYGMATTWNGYYMEWLLWLGCMFGLSNNCGYLDGISGEVVHNAM